MTTLPWSLECSHCGNTASAEGLPTVCPKCGDPWLVRYDRMPPPSEKEELPKQGWTMWRYRGWLPLRNGEEPVSLGEGMTPLLRWPALESALTLRTVWIKDESQNPTGSFKARGLSAAVTGAVRAGARNLTIPTAGNAGVALSAYARRAGLPVHVFAPKTTPATILQQIRSFGAELVLVDGHIGDCGKAARQFAGEHGAFDVSTLREPYRIEGKKTMGLELTEQMGWRLPTVIIYPAGGGTGLIGMWKAFRELREAGWLTDPMPRFYAVQSTGCAPVVTAFESRSEKTEPWSDPETVAAGLRVPAPLGGRLMLRALRDSKGGAVAVSDAELLDAQARLGEQGMDASPEGGATAAALARLVEQGSVHRDDLVVLFNTGAGWLYR
ncbi:MAG: threonine synthase [Gemmatimonadetes bacterium]|nr:threonine synthase [Gemmatimonadota bacterium]